MLVASGIKLTPRTDLALKCDGVFFKNDCVWLKDISIENEEYFGVTFNIKLIVQIIHVRSNVRCARFCFSEKLLSRDDDVKENERKKHGLYQFKFRSHFSVLHLHSTTLFLSNTQHRTRGLNIFLIFTNAFSLDCISIILGSFAFTLQPV